MKLKTTLLAAATLCAATATAQVVVTVDANQRGPKISPTHYGIFYEDINHAADGGIYAELIRNRSFEDAPRYGAPVSTEAWSTFASPGATLDMKLLKASKKVKLLNSVQQHALELTVNATKDAQACLVNSGFWGINAVQGRTYKLSFWAKGTYQGGIRATLCDAKGEKVFAETAVEAVVGKDWKKYTATLTATDNDPQAQFALVFDGKGILDLDVVSLFPPTFRNRENGLRPDLMQMLYNMHPKFMRFPGGCFVEGEATPENAFRWERTIGPIEERPGHWNVNWGYRTTDGLGFHEYLQMAEDLGAKPLYVVNIGIWHGGDTPLNKLQPWVDEALAALEYANGDVTTKYGAMRAKNGHPAPFNIEYLEIGNENNQPEQTGTSDHYYERFKIFKDQILARYPNIHLIGDVAAWGTDDPTWNSDETVELLDEHYYRNPAWFANNFHKYDTYKRGGSKIYVGEYAVTQGFGDLGNMNAALGEAVYMQGMENNSDVVPMNSYAPIFVNENDARWRPDMIRFSSSSVMGTPSYYVQALMAQNVGTQVIRVKQENPYDVTSVARVTPEKNRCGFATWETRATFKTQGEVEAISGDWQVNNGEVSQTGRRQQCVAVEPTLYDDDHYVYKTRARKDRGAEGFIVVFNYVDRDNYCWVNFGGWGNTQHGIEQVVGGSKTQTATKHGRIEDGRWYDVTIEVTGDNVKAWLDNDLVFDTQLKRNTAEGIFSSATLDETTGEMIVKVTNTSSVNTTARIDLKNFSAQQARVIRLAAAKGTDENTLQTPTHIYPVETSLSPQDGSVLVEVPAYSLNIVRVAPL